MASAVFRVVRGLLASVFAGSLVAVSAVSAWADTPSNWWYDYYKVADVQAEGWTGAGVKVAVIDGQINPNLPVFQGATLTVSKSAVCGGQVATDVVSQGSFHGTTVTALLAGSGEGANAIRGIAPKANITFYGYGDLDLCSDSDNSNGKPLSAFGRALKQSVLDGNRIITTSATWDSLAPGDIDVLAEAEAQGVIVISSTIDSYSEMNRYPYSLNGVVAVGSFDKSGHLMKDQKDSSRSMIFPEVTVVAAGVDFPVLGSLKSLSWDDAPRGSGSSLATPLVAGTLAVAWQKFPQATGNQLIQSLIHNTGTTDHALQRDTTGGLGYGPASLRHLLSVDPAKYPDVNPLMDKSYGKPTAQDVAAAGKNSGTESPTKWQSSQADPSPGKSSSDLVTGVLVVVGVVGLLVVVSIVLVIVLVVRKGRMSGSGKGM